MEIVSAICLIIIMIIALIQRITNMNIFELASIMCDEVKETKINNIKEDSYLDYTKFYGTESLKDEEFMKKMKIIYSQIMKDKEEDIKQIAELAGCTYTECIFKIRYLKQIKKIPEDYFVDEINGLVNRCSPEDQQLLKKYRPYIYRSQLQIPDIVARIPHIPGKTKEEMQQQVLNDLIYLDDKDLIDGIILNKVDGVITYYNKYDKKKKDKITVNCQNCGALNEVNRGGKTWCSYCGSIVEDKSLDSKENSDK